MSSVVHVTHEAVRKAGGIGAVLEGLATSRAYQRAIKRTILAGPLSGREDEARIAQEGQVLYSSVTGVRRGPYVRALDAVVHRYNVHLVYGRRTLTDRTTGGKADPEVLLVDPSSINPRLEAALKFNLYRQFGIQSDRYEISDDYQLYVRLAEPVYEAVDRLLEGVEGPHYVLAHEYMGMPTALKAVLEGDPRFRTVFYAHEVATVRPVVESAPGHDTMFYNVMEQALARGQGIPEVFGDQSHFYRHALVEAARFCDRVFAVGDFVQRELRFLGPALQDRPIDLVYNGIPVAEISPDEKRASRELLRQYAEGLLGFSPDVIFTHVTRMVVSKGLWRDLRVLEHLDGMFVAQGRRGVLFVLSTVAGARAPEQVVRMEADYGWPVMHYNGYPDLVGPEVDFWGAVSDYNLRARAIQVVFVNQFGWDQASCGVRMPGGMGFADLRKGTDVEFGMSIYEPFGIAQVEPLGFGALCVVSSVCGCVGFVRSAGGEAPVHNLIVGDYVRLEEAPDYPDGARWVGKAERDRLEMSRSRVVAEEILGRLPGSDAEREQALRDGYGVAKNMSWDRVCTEFFLPGLRRAAEDLRDDPDTG